MIQKYCILKPRYIMILVAITVVTAGCSMLEPAKKPETGPIGTTIVSHTNPPLLQRFETPPVELYDIETVAGTVFEGINNKKWSDAEAGFNNLQTTWQQAKILTGDKKGVKEADAALESLAISIKNKILISSYEDLNKFMADISDIGKSYKLSPLSDVIIIDNAIRNVSFYITDQNWTKGAAKAKELDDTWKAIKPNLEQVGILSEVTKAHSLVNQIKDSVNAENKGAFLEHSSKLNESMGNIRDFFRGK